MSEPRVLRAGPLRMVFSGDDLRHIRAGDRTILERIYVGVRDRNWDTVPGRIENLVIAQRADNFEITYDSIHRQGDVDFRWRATIAGSAAGRLSFALDGKSHSTFLRNRIGFCLHHPLRECAGMPCTLEAADGAVEHTAFPEFVSPYQVFRNMRAMAYQVAPGLRAEIRFSGDVFETEDHRNWTDANFKTYSTPLALPFPVEVKAGAEIHQRVEVAVQGPVGQAEPPRQGIVSVRVGGPAGTRLPALGLCAAGGRPLSEAEVGNLRRLRLNHIRIDLMLQGDSRPALENAVAEARAIGARLEAAVTLPGDIESLRAWSPLVDRWLIYHRDEKATGATAAKTVRAVLGPDAFLAVGTNAYFAELNRNRPSGGGWDAACFSANPQVHAFDDESVMQNASGQFYAVRAAHRFLGGRAVVVSPVTLRPRFNPDATGAAETPPPDPRQTEPFCSAWTVASLKALAEAGAAAVTYYETRGAGGVLDGADVYPVYEVFEAAGEFAGAEVLRSETSDSRKVAALALASGVRRRLLIANLTGEPCAVRTEMRPGPLALAPYGIARIDWTAA
jgi:hypothetical protein